MPLCVHINGEVRRRFFRFVTVTGNRLYLDVRVKNICASFLTSSGITFIFSAYLLTTSSGFLPFYKQRTELC